MRKCGRILRFLCMKCIEKSQKFWYNYIKKEKNCGHARCSAERTGVPAYVIIDWFGYLFGYWILDLSFSCSEEDCR